MGLKSVVMCFCFLPLLALGKTITSELVVGEWIGTGPDSNQRLSIAENFEGIWTIKLDGQNVSTRNIKTVQFQDFFVLDAKIDGQLVEKIVLSGWQYESGEALIGTRYLYHAPNKDLEIFNGIPISFQRKRTYENSRVVRFLTEPLEKRVSEKEFFAFLEEFKNSPALETNSTASYTIYGSPSVGNIAVTKSDHPAYPAMLSITSIPTLEDWQPDIESIVLLGRYAGSRSEFLKWRAEFGTELRSQYESIAPFKQLKGDAQD